VAVTAMEHGPGDSDCREDGLAVMAGQHGLDGGDDREDGIVHGRGSDGDGGGSSWGGGGVVPMVEEECDGTVPGHSDEGWADDVVPWCGDGMEAIEVAAASKRKREILAS
jgi:hypothetical protein